MEPTLVDELRTFDGREEALKAIPRYHIYHPMFHRTTDAIHAKRVGRITRFFSPIVAPHFASFDQTYAEAMALVHDDAEILTGDPQAGNKAKMPLAELAALEADEDAAIDELAKRFPKTLGGFLYYDLLRAVRARLSPEAQLVQFADKFDAFGESLHEITAGNLRFATPVTTEYGALDIPPSFYVEYFSGFAAKYPKLAFLTQGPEQQLDLTACAATDWLERAKNGRPHTADSLTEPSGLQPYDLWMRILLEDQDAAEIERLTLRVE